jgi:hypothetical protein
MTNLVEQAINCDDGTAPREIIQNALDIESDESPLRHLVG